VGDDALKSITDRLDFLEMSVSIQCSYNDMTREELIEAIDTLRRDSIDTLEALKSILSNI
jgi:hypothetical protein